MVRLLEGRNHAVVFLIIVSIDDTHPPAPAGDVQRNKARPGCPDALGSQGNDVGLVFGMRIKGFVWGDIERCLEILRNPFEWTDCFSVVEELHDFMARAFRY